MSNKTNTEWVEAAYENLEQAISGGHLKLAQDIIEDTRDAGFTEDADKMEEALKELPAEENENHE